MESPRSRPLPLPPLRLPEKAEYKEKPVGRKGQKLSRLTALPPNSKRVPMQVKKAKGPGYLRLAKVYGSQE